MFANKKLTCCVFYSAFAAISMSPVLCVQDVGAQVVYTFEVSEVYDDNIFLEDDGGLPADQPPYTVTDENGNVQEIPIPVDLDKSPDDDIISYVSLGVSGNFPVSKYLKTAGDFRAGYMFFGDYSDENRFTLNSLLRADAEKNLIPDPYTASLSSAFSTSQYNLGAPQGSTAQSTVTHDANLSLGVANLAVTPKVTNSLVYTLLRHDFLGTLSSGSDERADDDVVDGADWFSNKLSSTFNRQLSEQAMGALEFYGDLITYTSTSDTGFGRSQGDLDRFDYGTFASVDYAVSEKVSVKAGVGVDLTHYIDSPEPELVVILPGSGNEGSIVIDEQDNDIASLAFDTSITYQPVKLTNFSVGARQQASSDIEGDRNTTRSVYTALSQGFNEKIKLILSGQYFQFEEGDSLSDATDRFEGTSSLNFVLTDYLNLSLGYSYAKQDDSLEPGQSTPWTFEDDYTNSKAFITVSTGFVGIAN